MRYGGRDMKKKWKDKAKLMFRYEIIFRELMARNKIFIKDWEKLLAHQDSEDYEDLFEATQQKWDDIVIPIDDFLIVDALGTEENGSPSFSPSDEEPHHLTLRIDLRYPTKKIMEQVERWLYSYQSEYRGKLGRHYVLAPEDYELYIEVWDLREKEGKSWSQIKEELSLNSIQTARNHHKAACKLIKEGLPGFPPFPTE